MTAAIGSADVSIRLARVRERIATAGRDPAEVRIVAVTKGFPVSVVEAAYDAGCREFGENYANELAGKAAGLVSGHPGVVWHHLGAIQRNKVKVLSPHVGLWQAVDRFEEGVEIARHAPGAAVLVQVVLAEGPTRAGCDPGSVPGLVEALAALDLDVRGLMGVAGRTDPGRDFAALARLGASLGLDELSMGMSGDLEAAVAEGSTMVRVGTALFGARPGAR